MKQQPDIRNDRRRSHAHTSRFTHEGSEKAALARIHRAATLVRARREQLYDRYADRVYQRFVDGRDRSVPGLERAMDAAGEQLASAGAFTPERGATFRAFLARDIARTAVEFTDHGDDEAAGRLRVARLDGGSLGSLVDIVQHADDALAHLDEDEALMLEYHTGELTSAGVLSCIKCRKGLRFRATGTVPPCPHCSATEFRKGF